MVEYNVFKNGKKFALTMSYDDGQIFDLRLIDIFDKHGIRGTFNLNSSNIGTPGHVTAEDIRTKYKNHEVAVHTAHHPWLERCTKDTIYREIMDDRTALEKMCGYVVRGMAYPFGTHDETVRRIAKDCGIVYSRSCDNLPWFDIPRDFMQWPGTCHHRNCLEYAEQFLERINDDSRWRAPSLFYVWGHSFEFDRNNNWELIEEFCEKVGDNDKVWYATNIEIYDYVTAQRALRVSGDEKIIENPTDVDVWIRRDGETVKIPAACRITF